MLFLRGKNIGREVVQCHSSKFSYFYDVSPVIIKIRPRSISALVKLVQFFCAFANAFNCLEACVFLCIYVWAGLW